MHTVTVTISAWHPSGLKRREHRMEVPDLRVAAMLDSLPAAMELLAGPAQPVATAAEPTQDPVPLPPAPEPTDDPPPASDGEGDK